MISKESTFLVIDDQVGTRTLVKAILGGLGFKKILVAENGAQGLEQVNQGTVDIVICDWNMPTMTGIEFLEKVRADARFKELPVIMLTAETYRENIKEAMKYGVSDYIAKPFTADTIAQKLKRFTSEEI